MAVRNRANLKAVTNTRYADNTTGNITAGYGRDTHGDIADSAVLWEDDVSDDATFAAATDNALPTALAVKTYVDNTVAGGAGAISGSLTSGRVPVASGAGSLTDYNTLTFDGNNLAIGAVSPDSLLHVWASSAGTVAARTNTLITIERNGAAYISILTPDASERGIFFGEASDNDAGGILYNTPSTNDGFEFITAGSARLYIDSSGKVGIGGSPSYNLDVQGSSASFVITRIRNSGSGNTQVLLERTGGTTSAWDIYLPSGSTDLRFFSGSDRFAFTSAGVFKILTTPSTDNTATPLAIDGSGNVVKNSNIIQTGTYTPTLTNSTNVSSSTAFACQYMRVGSIVTVSGKLQVTCSVDSADSILHFSLPIASDFTQDYQLSGVGCFYIQDSGETGICLYADATNNRGSMNFESRSTSSENLFFTFTYQIL